MSGLIEQLGTLRAVGVDGDEKQLQLLLRTAGYNVERAINHYFESGLPGLPSPALQECANPSPSPSPPVPARALTAAPPSLPVAESAAKAQQVVALTRGEWPKLVGERWITGYTTRRGSLQYRENIGIISEGSGTSRASPQGKGKAPGGRGAQGKLWGGRGGGGGRFGRPKASSAGAMSHILFRGSKGGVEGRLPREVCTFLAPLLQKGLVRAHAEAVCDLPGLGVFADVPLKLSIEIEEGVFALDPDEELYRNAYCLLQFAHTGNIEQELQPKTQQAPANGSGGGGKGDGDGTALTKGELSAPRAEQQGGETSEAKKKSPEEQAAQQDEEEEEEEEEEATRIREEDAEKLYQSELCEMPEAPDPTLFVEGLTLRRYQRQALAWMIQREKKRYVTEEDCTGLSMGAAAATATEAEPAVGHHPPPGEADSGGDGSVSIRDGCVTVASWSRSATNGEGGADCGGGVGVAMHPLWERRAAASRAASRTAQASTSVSWSEGGSVDFLDGGMFGAVSVPGDHHAPAGEQGSALSQPEAFYVNVYSRRYQREFPPATLGCRGGILADEMGMGKTVMLLSLILSDKERQRGDGSGVEDNGEGREEQDQDQEERQAREGEEEEEDTYLAGGGGGEKASAICLDDDEHEKPNGDAGDHDDDSRVRTPASVPVVGGSKRKRRLVSAPDADAAPPPSTGGSIATTKRRRRSSSATPSSSSTVPLDVSTSGDDSSGSGEESEFMPSSEKGRRTNTGDSDSDSDDDSDDDGDDDDGDSDSDFDPGTGTGNSNRSSKGKSRAAVASTGRGDSKRRRGGAGAKPSNSNSGSGCSRGGGGDRGRGSGGVKAGSCTSAPPEDSDDVETLEVRVVGEDHGAGAGAIGTSRGGRRRAGRGDGDGGMGMRGGTLVVCPLSLIGQWRGELESKTRKGAISVCFHYGAGRSRSTRELCRKDVVLTTYGVLSSEMAKHEADAKARASTAPATAAGGGGGGGGGTAGGATGRGSAAHKNTGGLLGVEWSRVILDEAHSIRNTNTEQSRACLALEAEQRWAVTGTPIQNSLDDMAALLAFLRHEPWSDRGWWRKVIADPYKDGDMEALRRLKTVLAPILLRRTKNTLDSRGRPIVELPPKTVEIVRLELSPEEREFYEALKKRSKIEFEGYVAAGTVMKSYIAILTLLLRLRQACNHPFLVLGKGFSSSKSAPGMIKQKHQQQQASLKPAAGAPTTADADGLDLQDTAAGLVEAGAGDGDAGNAPPHYVQELYRRYRERVAADLSAKKGLGGDGAGTDDTDGGGAGQEADGERPKEECPVCLEEPMVSPALTPCAHLMCQKCLRDCLHRESCCPVCRSEMAEADIIEVHDSQPTAMEQTATAPAVKPSSPSHPSGEAAVAAGKSSDGAPRGGGGGGGGGGGWIGSTKLGRLEFELREMRRKRPGAKAVVFSQWTHMLDLAETSIGREGWTHRRLDGAMSQQRRESALKSFATDESVAVMLVSLKAGGVGLNLTAASTVILLDPWWNPAVEEQAIDRIHRLGQLSEVSVKRFVVEGTVEDKMLALQEVKGRMAKNALAAGSVSESQKLRVEDLMQFFK